MKSLFIFVFCVTFILVKARRIPIEKFPFETIFAPQVNVPTATPATTVATVTTESPKYRSCFQSCPSTMEYNPVCGTDSQNYHNMGRLGCAKRCGRNVDVLRSGICIS